MNQNLGSKQYFTIPVPMCTKSAWEETKRNNGFLKLSYNSYLDMIIRNYVNLTNGHVLESTQSTMFSIYGTQGPLAQSNYNYDQNSIMFVNEICQKAVPLFEKIQVELDNGAVYVSCRDNEITLSSNVLMIG